MTDIPKLHLVGDPNSANLFRFTLTKTAIPAPDAPVDEASVKIVEAVQKRDAAEAEAARTLAEANRALAEAQKLTEAEPQKLPEPPPLTAEEKSQEWNIYFIAQNAPRLDLEDRENREELALQQEALDWEKECLDAEKKFIDEMHQRAGTRRIPATVAQVPQVPPVKPDAEVAQVKPARTRTYNKLI